MSLRKFLVVGFVAVALLAPTTSSAATLSELMAQLTALQAQIAALGGETSSSTSCVTLTRNLYFGVQDAQTGGEVSKLQKYLGGQVTGYFGPATELLVQAWQKKKGIASSGTPDTTGYGAIGPKTRLLMACGTSTGTTGGTAAAYTGLLKITSPSAATTMEVGDTLAVTYVVGGEVEDEATLKRSIINAKTGATNSTYETIEVTPGEYSFEWSPVEAGAYKAKLVIENEGKTRTVKSATVTATGSAISGSDRATPTISLSLSDSSIDSGDSATLTWSATDATRCFLQYDSKEQSISTSGSKTVSPSKTTTYRVTCANDSGDGKDGPTDSESVKLTVGSGAAPSCSISLSSNDQDTSYMENFGSDKFYVRPHADVTLSWTSKNANYVLVGGEKASTSGSVTYEDLTDEVNEYTFTAQGSNSSATCDATVYVNWKG